MPLDRLQGPIKPSLQNDARRVGVGIGLVTAVCADEPRMTRQRLAQWPNRSRSRTWMGARAGGTRHSTGSASAGLSGAPGAGAGHDAGLGVAVRWHGAARTKHLLAADHGTLPIGNPQSR